jgi:DNA polymerase elongation subunit (family B)
MVRNLMNEVLEIMMKKKDKQEVINHTKKVIEDLLMYRIPVYDLAISKGINLETSNKLFDTLNIKNLKQNDRIQFVVVDKETS